MKRKSFCRICSSACGIIVETEGERVLSVRGDTEHPLTKGYTCSKGRGLPNAHHREDRLATPMMQRDGRLEIAGWEEALDDVAAKLRAIIDESGPGAIGVFLGGGGYMDSSSYAMVRSITSAIGTPALYSDMSIDVISKMIVSELMMGVGGMLTRPDFGRCPLILYIGTNPVVSHGHTSMLNVPARRLREMTTLGQVWVLDPRRTETANKASRHIAAKPGSDYAVLAWLIREVLREGADHDYLAAHAQDVDALALAVESFTLAKATEISGAASQDLLDLLMATRSAGRICVETGTGVSMSSAANVTQWLSWALMIVMGSLDREGGAWINPGFLSQLDKMDVPLAPPEGWRQPGPSSRPELAAIIGEFPAVAIPDEIEAGNLRALINLSGNLMTCMPGTNRTSAALRRLEVLLTVEIHANDTTAISTHVFPAKDQLERADLSCPVDTSFPVVGVQYTPAMVAPLEGTRSYWWTLAQIGKRLGLDFLPGIDPDTASDEDVLAHIAARARPGLDPRGEAHYVVDEERVFGWIERKADALGGWRLAPPSIVAQLALMKPPAPLVLIPRRQMHHLNSRVLDPRDQPAIFVHADDAASAGVAEGELAKVRTVHGSLEGVIRIDATLQPGVLSVPHGWRGAHNVNQLTSTDDVDPLTGMPRMSGLPITLEPAAAT